MKKEFFDKCAGEWHYPPESKYKLIQENIIPLLDLKQTDTVLDACCGTGFLIPLLKGKCAKIFALDYSVNMLNKAEEINGNAASYIEASIEDAYCDDEEFDKIILHNALPHIDDKQKAFKECSRILKPCGILVISHDANKNQIDAFHKKCSHPVKNDMLPSNKEIIIFASAAGFKTVEILDEENYFAAVCKK
ncbi:MAG: class I SAM-dependent methyltransferase [Endomicrobium sp.]|jgi:ubiquinone/menaquinone biosynthesis C-methylase UbiE|nr:class I SAM-dependent methyltransferase [Endomicrobium sp.]